MSNKHGERSGKIPTPTLNSDISIDPVQRSVLTIIVQYLDKVDYDFLMKVSSDNLSGDALNVAKAIILKKFPEKRDVIGYKGSPAIDRVVDALLSWNKAVSK